MGFVRVVRGIDEFVRTSLDAKAIELREESQAAVELVFEALREHAASLEPLVLKAAYARYRKALASEIEHETKGKLK
jgi:hypothetical protein